MSTKQYDVPESVQTLYKLKQERLRKTKQYFRSIVENPHRPINDPIPFDPVMYRFNSLKNYAVEHYKFTPKKMLFISLYVILPLTVFYYLPALDVDPYNEKVRNGLIPYSERKYRTIY